MEWTVAYIGCGKRAQEHARGQLADPRAKVVALADPKTESAEAFKETNGFDAPIFADHREMLAQVKPQVVIASLWTPLHLPVFRDCVEAGVKGVLSEKPMAPTWGECRELAKLADDSGVQLTFCHQRRFAKGNLLARKLIADGVLGTLKHMDLYSPPNLLDCGTHTFDQAFSFNAETPVKWVLAAVDMSAPIEWFGVKAEGMAIGQLVYENGVRANIQLGGPDMDLWGGVRVVGEEGFLDVMWDGDFRRAVRYDDPKWQPPKVEEGHDPMVDVIANALDCLETGAEPELSHKKALAATEVIFGMYESVRRSRRIELPIEGFDDNPLHEMIARGCFS